MTHPRTRSLATFILGAVLIAGTAAAQSDGHKGMDHAAHMKQMMGGEKHGAAATNTLSEPGQGAFAALAEAVRVLEADPATDWSKVDITALRDHLVDMDRVVRDTVVRREDLPGGIRATVTGDEATLASVRRMVPAHAVELARDSRWLVEIQVNDADVVLTVTSEDPATAARIKALGFYGLMASQDHHRAHHMKMARGGAHGH